LSNDFLKFFLHINSDEQERRLLARRQEKTKAWKLSAADWAERKYWSEYQAAYGGCFVQVQYS